MIKKLLIPILLLVITAFFSCKKDYGNNVTPISLTVKTIFNQDGELAAYAPESAQVKLTNLRNGVVTYLKINGEGHARFNSITPGRYTIEVSLKITDEEFFNLTGHHLSDGEEERFYNGSIQKAHLTNPDEQLQIVLNNGAIGDWVIKQIYYAGSDQWDGANFRDQFIEFYNNTSKVLYADSLYFAQIFGENNSSPDMSTGWYDPDTRQLNWRIPTGMSNANHDYVYAYHLFMIPGTGKQYPVQPGESIVLAQNALNHKAPYIDNNGNVQGINRPELTVDLSNADFDAYLVDYNREFRGKTFPYRWDIDNPKVPNIEVLLTTHNDLILDNLGRDGYAIFKAESRHYVDSLMKYRSFKSPKLTQTTDKNRFIQIPIDIIIDAVELQSTLTSDRMPKRLNSRLDAGFTFVPNGEYSSQSMVRKTSKTINGRRVLKDTNNSTEDFKVSNRPIPKGFID